MTQQVKMPEHWAERIAEGTAIDFWWQNGTKGIQVGDKLITTDQAEAYKDACVREALEWISVSDRLPEIGDWVNVLLDRNEGDFFERRGKPRYSVYSAQLREVDSEGFATWQRWKMADGGPMGALYLVTHWRPLPSPPQHDNE